MLNRVETEKISISLMPGQ
jgi:hypothetical protein